MHSVRQVGLELRTAKRENPPLPICFDVHRPAKGNAGKMPFQIAFISGTVVNQRNFNLFLCGGDAQLC